MAIARDTARTTPETHSPERRVVRLTIPARAEYITLCRLALTGLAGLRPLADELYTDRLVIEVRDDGEGFDHPGENDLGDLENLSEGGLGIAIIRAIADEFELTSGAGGRGSRLRFA